MRMFWDTIYKKLSFGNFDIEISSYFTQGCFWILAFLPQRMVQNITIWNNCHSYFLKMHFFAFLQYASLMHVYILILEFKLKK